MDDWIPLVYMAVIIVLPALVLGVMGWRWHRDVCKGHDRCLPPGVLSTEKAKTVEQLQRERIVCARCLGRGSVSTLVGGSLGHVPCPECHA